MLLTGSRSWTQTREVPTRSEFERLLRGAALRVTRPRVAVLSAVYASPHADTDQIIEDPPAGIWVRSRTRLSTTCSAR